MERTLNQDEKEEYVRKYTQDIEDKLKNGTPYTSSTNVFLRVVKEPGMGNKNAQDIVLLIATERRQKLEDLGYVVMNKGYFYLPHTLIEEARGKARES